MNVPADLKYIEEHTWVRMEKGRAYIGITDFAQSELGEIVFIELPEQDDEITQGTSFGNIESAKTVSELIAPVSGKVIEVNEELEDEPTFVNESPYKKGWMIVVSVTSQLDKLISAEEYKKNFK
jgi:glycine cleavage system H protein